jgi:hypothetical protein
MRRSSRWVEVVDLADARASDEEGRVAIALDAGPGDHPYNSGRGSGQTIGASLLDSFGGHFE